MRAGSKITMNRDTDTETLLHVKSLIEANIDPQVILDLDQALLKSKHTQSTEECFQLSKQLVETLSKYDPQQQDNDQVIKLLTNPVSKLVTNLVIKLATKPVVLLIRVLLITLSLKRLWIRPTLLRRYYPK